VNATELPIENRVTASKARGRGIRVWMYLTLPWLTGAFAAGCGGTALDLKSATPAAQTPPAPSSTGNPSSTPPPPATSPAPAPSPTPAPPPTPQPSPTRFVRPLQRAIWIGDSLAAGGFPLGGTATTTDGSFMVSGGPQNPVASITTRDPHGLIPGNYVQIYNVGDVNYQAALNGAVETLLSAPSSTQLTVPASLGVLIMPNGDYSAGYLNSPWQVSAMNQMLGTSWLSWLNAYMDGYFTVVANYAQGGTSSQVGVALLPKIKAGPVADYAFIQYCTNDVNAMVPPDVQGCLANINTIVSAVLAMGMVPVVSTPLAIGDLDATPSDPASAAKTAALKSIRIALLQLAAANPNVIVLDTYNASVDPQDSLGRFKPNYAPIDGIHPSTFGAASIAKAMATYLEQFLTPVDTFPTSVNDDQTINPNASNIVQNGLMAGSGGNVGTSAGNSVQGSPPTGWEISGSGGTQSAPLSLAISGNNTHANFPGYTLNVDIQTAYPGQAFQIGTNGIGGSSFGARMHANQWYRCGFQAFSQSDLNGLNLSGTAFLNFGNGAEPDSVYFLSTQGSVRENGLPLSAGLALTFESQPFYVPVAPAAGGYLFINGFFSSAVSNQTISIGRAFCRTVPSPYQ
jgi:lysophospholipase L1-like esterase